MFDPTPATLTKYFLAKYIMKDGFDYPGPNPVIVAAESKTEAKMKVEWERGISRVILVQEIDMDKLQQAVKE